MKPSWKDAPEWANWLAMDDDGEWVWFYDKPELAFGLWSTKASGLEAECGDDFWDRDHCIDAELTLESRP